MKVELLVPTVFGRGEFKVGDTVEVCHTLGKEMILGGQAVEPGKKKKKQGSGVRDQVSGKNGKGQSVKSAPSKPVTPSDKPKAE